MPGHVFAVVAQVGDEVLKIIRTVDFKEDFLSLCIPYLINTSFVRQPVGIDFDQEATTIDTALDDVITRKMLLKWIRLVLSDLP